MNSPNGLISLAYRQRFAIATLENGVVNLKLVHPRNLSGTSLPARLPVAIFCRCHDNRKLYTVSMGIDGNIFLTLFFIAT